MGGGSGAARGGGLLGGGWSWVVFGGLGGLGAFHCVAGLGGAVFGLGRRAGSRFWERCFKMATRISKTPISGEAEVFVP